MGKHSRALTSARAEELRKECEALYRKWHHAEFAEGDPLSLLDRTLSGEDLEILSFLVAGLSYGRVEQIQKSAKNLLLRLGGLGISGNGAGLSKYLKTSFHAESVAAALKGWKHRLNTARDLEDLFVGLSKTLQNYDSLGALFASCFDESPQKQIEKFCAHLLRACPRRVRSKKVWRGTGAEWFFASPENGGTSKRLLMWLRWMIRGSATGHRDEIDLGLWKDFADPSRLFVPLDTHIAQFALSRRLVKTKSPNWNVVAQLTKVFSELCPEDPARYDFAICQAGMRSFRAPRPRLVKGR